MAIVKPFAAVRPRPETAAQVCELPYDVLSSDEARLQVEGKPSSFFHVSKPEVDFPMDVNPYSEVVYQRGSENFQRLITSGALFQDDEPCYYLYRQTMATHSQLGLVAVTSCQEYLDGVIKKHELTRPDKEDDRVRHIDTLDAQTGPVFLTYRNNHTLQNLMQAKTQEAPSIDFTAQDGVRHMAWVISERGAMEEIEKTFSNIPNLYIADGHHRSAAAARVYRTRNGAGSSGLFLSVLFPHNQLRIMPYNRVVKDLNGLSVDDFIKKLRQVFICRRRPFDRPSRAQEVGLFIDGRWFGFKFKPAFFHSHNPVEQLDVWQLQQHVLDPILGITDPRTSNRIKFVGGIRGTGELEKLVNTEGYACAFSMYPTQIDDLMAIADAGQLMPPKSTWFEPKLRDGMFSHLIGPKINV